MDHQINEGGVRHVAIGHNDTGGPCNMVHAFIHHELTPEREQQLLAAVEAAILTAVKAWVQA